MRCLACAAVLVVCIGCGTAQYRDVSGSAKYAPIVGRDFETLESLLVFGISTDPADGTVDEYRISQKPGIGGLGVLTRGSIPAGSVLRVKKILDCTNCLVSETRLLVEILSDERYSDWEVAWNDPGNVLIFGPDQETAEMNPELFQPRER